LTRMRWTAATPVAASLDNGVAATEEAVAYRPAPRHAQLAEGQTDEMTGMSVAPDEPPSEAAAAAARAAAQAEADAIAMGAFDEFDEEELRAEDAELQSTELIEVQDDSAAPVAVEGAASTSGSKRKRDALVPAVPAVAAAVPAVAAAVAAVATVAAVAAVATTATVAPKAAASSTETITVRLYRINGRLGLGLNDDNCVTAMPPNGAAALHGNIYIGDQVVAVDGQRTSKSATVAQLLGALPRTQSSIKITLLRSEDDG